MIECGGGAVANGVVEILAQGIWVFGTFAIELIAPSLDDVGDEIGHAQFDMKFDEVCKWMKDGVSMASRLVERPERRAL